MGENIHGVLTKTWVKFSVSILYSHGDQIFVIDVQRLYGDSLGYNMMYKKFKSALKALLGEGDNETTDTDFGTTELVPLTDEELDAEDVIVSVKNNETLLDNEVDMSEKNKMFEDQILSFFSEGKTFEIKRKKVG